MAPSSAPRRREKGLLKRAASFFSKPPRAARLPMEPKPDALASFDAGPIGAPQSSPSPADDLMVVTLAQGASGAWNLTAELATVCGTTVDQLARAARALGADKVDAEQVVATLAALQLLRSRFSTREDEWRLLAAKAERWLGKQKLTIPKGFATLQDWFGAAI